MSASVSTILTPDDAPPPLALIDMGDGLPQGGFRQASEFVNWDFFNEQPKSIFSKRAWEIVWAPFPTLIRSPIKEDYVWSEDEDAYLDGVFGRDIASPAVHYILLKTRKAVIQSYIRRHGCSTNPRLSIEPTPVEREQELMAQSRSIDRFSQEDACNSDTHDMLAPALSAPRKSERQRRRKRHFDEVD